MGCVNMDLTPSDQAASGAVWGNATMAEQSVNGVYNMLYYGYNNAWLGWWDTWSYMMDLDANWVGGFGSLLGNNTSTNDRASTRWWQVYYAGIFRANDVIENMPNVPNMDESERSRLVSEARFLRSWWYYRLNALYGNIPYYTKALTSTDDTKNAKQCTQDEMWANLVTDLTLCIEDKNLPDKYSSSDDNYGHITKGAAYALRGIVYMWQKQWQKAINDFQSVKDCGYKLYTGSGTNSYKQLFKLANEHCDEMIFSIQCTDKDNGSSSHQKNHFYGSRCLPNDGSGVGLGWTNYIVNPRFVDSYENADGSPFNWDDYIPGYSSMTPKARAVYFYRDGLTDSEYANAEKNGADMSKYLKSGNEARILKAYSNRDPRLGASVVTPYSIYSGGISGVATNYTYRFPYRTLNAPTYDYATDITAMAYYTNRKFVGEGMELIVNYSPVDLPLIRYGQILLLWAEALNEAGQTDEAVNKVNEVRNRAGAQPLNSNTYTQVAGKDDLKQRIMKESHWELLAEDVVFFDELRWKTWKDLKFATTDDNGAVNGMSQWWGKVTYSYKWGGDNYWILPIPANAVQIDHLTQNPGYN
ncbi:RagB/SusD family nutrient uptake outer membrane protein [Bacteroidaceae bacterium HV4-6-C5C]|nr:RagB/SusD family nutrient uptake outer membrane protein [Bacteroidaceae bacterium HV4-6-C5C]